MGDDFYAQLEPVGNFRDITRLDVYTPAPRDWYVVVTDIRGSTRAINEGRYKEVNLVGATPIVAILNIDRSIELPYIFGGDGATILIPPSFVERAKGVLAALIEIAAVEFGFDLRAAIVPMTALDDSAYAILVAKIRTSENLEQAAFTGGGLAYIEKLVKDPLQGRELLIERAATAAADMGGLECRWQDIPSRHGETVTLLVMATDEMPNRSSNIYRDVIEQIEAVYGMPDQFRPIDISTLRPSFNFGKLSLETRLRVSGRWLGRLLYLWKIWIQNWMLLFLWRNRVELGGVQWDEYLDLLVETSDYRKYDDTLRMVLTGNAVQREALVAYLEQRHQCGDLVYGFSVSESAVMTCVVFERMGRQVHFVGWCGRRVCAGGADAEAATARTQHG
ncbi:MAG: DUF3095 domain-containing protein [Chloroflexaceae bacterium]|nr:DUF3095 domain-containing protein [Chloroflexaceae bacterium]